MSSRICASSSTTRTRDTGQVFHSFCAGKPHPALPRFCHIAAIGLVAALADGDRNAAEQQQLELVARDFGGDDFDEVARRILSGQSRLEDLVAALSDGEAKQQAYEIAV